MRRTYVEVSCDNCERAIDHVRPGNVSKKIRDAGGIVSADGKDFCDEACRKEYRTKRSNPNK